MKPITTPEFLDESSTIQEHPIAQLFPDMSQREYWELQDDIKARGLKVPILVWRGQLIDGRHRLRACLAAGVQPRFQEADCLEEELNQLVWSLNAVRRQLTVSQRAMVGALMSAESGEGRPKKALPGPGADTAHFCAVSQSDAAALVDVSRRTVQSANQVLKRDHYLAKQVHAGKMTLSQAHRKGWERDHPPPTAKDWENEEFRQRLENVIAEGNLFRGAIEGILRWRPESCSETTVTDPVCFEMEGELKRVVGSICLVASKLRGPRIRTDGDET